jgi:hypothetical protein
LILVDANLLIYAYVDTYRDFAKTRDWLDGQINAGAAVGMPWASLLAFMRIVTNPRIHATPAKISDACEQVEKWLGADKVWIPEPGLRHREILLNLLRGAGSGGKLVPDAHLAALAIEHGLTICSADKDFARFSGAKWMNPLTA